MSLSSIGRLLQLIGVCLLIVAVAVRAADLMDHHQVNKSNQSTNSLVFYSSGNSANGSDSRPKPHRIKINRKRCRYSEQEIEEMNSRNLKRLSSSATSSSSSNNGQGVGYYNTRDSGNDAASVGRINSKHQPKVRDQFHMRYGDANHPGYSIDYQPPSQQQQQQQPHYHHQQQTSQLERETIFANIGDKINLTCHIRAREIDWHFRDKNHTTTILSFGLQLQVASQPSGSSSGFDFADYLNGFGGVDNDLFMSTNQEKSVKYALSSDRHSTHVLTLHVQGPQDEGAYQCIDSKSEIPVKKTILVYLKNDSRALTSGNSKLASIAIFYALTLLITVLNS